jgi:imidazoleglycerol phosphate dehydratase HisB
MKSWKCLDLGHVGGLWPFVPLAHIEPYPITFGQRFEAITRDRRKMDEHVGAAVLLDEPETFSVVEPLNRTFCHFNVLLFFSGRAEGEKCAGKFN